MCAGLMDTLYINLIVNFCVVQANMVNHIFSQFAVFLCDYNYQTNIHKFTA